MKYTRVSANPFLKVVLYGVLSALGFLTVHFTAVPAVAQEVTVSKRCGRYHREVPLSSVVGEACPYCHARWSYEHTSHENARSTSAVPERATVPSYNNSWYSQPTYTPMSPLSDVPRLGIPEFKPINVYRNSKARHKRKYRTRRVR